MDLLAALTWDPQIRGALIVLTAIVILPGSVYLLLGTNTGARLGLLLSIAGLSGWMVIMGVVWMVFGIGLKGRDPEWKPMQLVNGQLANRVTVEEVRETFPHDGWQRLTPTDKIYGDAIAAADHVLAPVASAGGHGAEAGPSPEEQARFASPFRNATDYEVVAAYRKGGDNELFTIGQHKFFFRHSPHYAVVQVKAKPDARNPTAARPDVTLVMVRDLGNVRFPPFLVTLSSLIVFGITCSVLHERDKEIMRARGQIPATA
jgi:hypothetical protein